MHSHGICLLSDFLCIFIQEYGRINMILMRDGGEEHTGIVLFFFSCSRSSSGLSAEVLNQLCGKTGPAANRASGGVHLKGFLRTKFRSRIASSETNYMFAA